MSLEGNSEYSYSTRLQYAFLTTSKLHKNVPDDLKSCATSLGSEPSIFEGERSEEGCGDDFFCGTHPRDVLDLRDTDSELSSDDSAATVTDSNTFDVIIIGAGLSALSALRELLLYDGSMRIQLLEARDYIGGRVLSTSEKVINGCVVQLAMGAAWIHGDIGNPLLELGRDSLDMKTVSPCNPWMRPPVDGSNVTVSVAGREVDVSSSSEIWKAFVHKVEKDPSIGTLSLADALCKYLSSEEQLNPLIIRNTALCECWSGASSACLPAECLIGSDGFIDNATNTKVSNADGSSLFGDFPGSHCLLHNSADIISNIVNSIGNKDAIDKMVRLNAPVGSISLCDIDEAGTAGSVAVATRDGKTYFSNHVIVTAPLKPLQRIIFEPPLPAAKTAAMNRVSYCCYKKVQLEFSVPFWSASDPFFVLINSDRHKKILGPSLILDNFLNLRGLPILEAVIVGSFGEAMTGKSDGVIQNFVIEALSEHFSVTEVINCTISRWEEDPYSAGAYSFHSMAYQCLDVDTIKEPVRNVIFFAGEHTDPVIYGSLNAAHSSGVRAAKEVLSAMRGMR